MSTSAFIRENFPDVPFDDRWYVVERLWGTPDPTEIIPKYAAEVAGLAWGCGTDIVTIGNQIGLFARSPSLDRVLEILAEAHGVRYSHAWLTRAIRAEVCEVFGGGMVVQEDDEMETRHDALGWALMVVEDELKGIA